MAGTPHTNEQSGRSKLALFVLFTLGACISVVGFVLVLELYLIEPAGNLAPLAATLKEKLAAAQTLQEVIQAKIEFYLAVAQNIWPSWGVPLSGILLTLVLIMFSGSMRRSNNVSVLRYYLEQEKRQRRMLERRMEDADKKILHAHEESSDAFFLVEQDLHILHANPQAISLFNQWNEVIENLEEQHLRDIIPDFENSGLKETLLHCFDEDLSWEGEIELKSHKTWLQGRIFPARSGMFVLLRDVTHFKKPAALLERGHLILHQMAASLPLPVAVVDMDWNYLLVSPRWKEVFHIREPGSLEGASHAKLLPGVPGNLNMLRGKLVQGKTLKSEGVKHTINGQEERITWEIRPWKNALGEVAGCIMVAEVVTDQFQVAQRQSQERQKEKMLAYHDLLTGLPNRQLFYDRLNMSLAQAYRQLNQVALMFLDLDGFKAVNDTLGHDVGDMLLKEVATRLKGCVRETDTVSRLGGDEFTVILNGVENSQRAADVAEKILVSIATPFHLAGKEVKIGTSIGISMYPEHGSSTTELIKSADTAMYRAKEGGKNRFFFYQQSSE